MKLTTKQRIYMSIAATNPHGVVEKTFFGVGGGLQRLSWDKMMGGLVKEGFMKPYVHGGYEITEAGRAILFYEGKQWDKEFVGAPPPSGDMPHELSDRGVCLHCRGGPKTGLIGVFCAARAQPVNPPANANVNGYDLSVICGQYGVMGDDAYALVKELNEAGALAVNPPSAEVLETLSWVETFVKEFIHDYPAQAADRQIKLIEERLPTIRAALYAPVTSEDMDASPSTAYEDGYQVANKEWREKIYKKQGDEIFKEILSHYNAKHVHHKVWLLSGTAPVTDTGWIDEMRKDHCAAVSKMTSADWEAYGFNKALTAVKQKLDGGAA